MKNPRKEVNAVLKKEAAYFGDIIILPFMDRYELLVLKTKAICEFGEWPEEVYPPYANGPAYILSEDIVTFIVSQDKNRRLRLFKMEDVSMGMWVERFNSIAAAVQYSHNWKLSVWMHGRLLHCTLPITKVDDLSMGQIGKRKSSVLQL